MGDWVIDGIRVNGAEINPSQLTLNFSSGFDFRDMVSVDNMKAGVTVGLKQNLFTPPPTPPPPPPPPPPPRPQATNPTTKATTTKVGQDKQLT